MQIFVSIQKNANLCEDVNLSNNGLCCAKYPNRWCVLCDKASDDYHVLVHPQLKFCTSVGERKNKNYPLNEKM